MIDFNEVYVMGLNASYEDAIKKASEGEKVIIPRGVGETENGKPCLDLVNFSEHEAKELHMMIDDMIGGGSRLSKLGA